MHKSALFLAAFAAQMFPSLALADEGEEPIRIPPTEECVGCPKPPTKPTRPTKPKKADPVPTEAKRPEEAPKTELRHEYTDTVTDVTVTEGEEDGVRLFVGGRASASFLPAIQSGQVPSPGQVGVMPLMGGGVEAGLGIGLTRDGVLGLEGAYVYSRGTGHSYGHSGAAMLTLGITDQVALGGGVGGQIVYLGATDGDGEHDMTFVAPVFRGQVAIDLLDPNKGVWVPTLKPFVELAGPGLLRDFQLPAVQGSYRKTVAPTFGVSLDIARVFRSKDQKISVVQTREVREVKEREVPLPPPPTEEAKKQELMSVE